MRRNDFFPNIYTNSEQVFANGIVCSRLMLSMRVVNTLRIDANRCALIWREMHFSIFSWKPKYSWSIRMFRRIKAPQLRISLWKCKPQMQNVECGNFCERVFFRMKSSLNSLPSDAYTEKYFERTYNENIWNKYTLCYPTEVFLTCHSNNEYMKLFRKKSYFSKINSGMISIFSHWRIYGVCQKKNNLRNPYPIHSTNNSYCQRVNELRLRILMLK